MPRAIRAIDTTYRGYRFRSRLEARWAVYLDAIGVRWDYEPEGFDLGDGIWYLPDFWLPQVRMWAEVKPEFQIEHLLPVYRLVRTTSHPALRLEGVPSLRSCESLWWAEALGCYETYHVAVSRFRDYPAREGRFYADMEPISAREFEPDGMFADCLVAVMAARGARFEHADRRINLDGLTGPNSETRIA